MKKILFFLACLTLGILSSVVSEAQISVTTGTNPSWNLDTTYVNVTGTTQGSFATKSVMVGTNNILVLVSRIMVDTLPASPTFTGNSKTVILQGSMDNTNWTAVPLTSSGALGTAYITRSFFGAISSGSAASWPSVGLPTVATSGAGTAIAGSSIYNAMANDSLALPLATTVKHACQLTITVPTPTYSYYRLVYTFSASGNFGALRIAHRYYFRKPY
jgi:hypothetical protein